MEMILAASFLFFITTFIWVYVKIQIYFEPGDTFEQFFTKIMARSNESEIMIFRMASRMILISFAVFVSSLFVILIM